MNHPRMWFFKHILTYNLLLYVVCIWSRLPPTRPTPRMGWVPQEYPSASCFAGMVPLGISTHAMHILKSNSLRTTCSYIYTIPYIPFKNHLAISYACILPIYYLHAIYLLSMGYLHKTYILSKCYVETIYRSIYIYTIYMLPICFLYSILYVYYLSCICTFFFCIFNIYIYIKKIYIYIKYIYIHIIQYIPTHT